MKKIIYSIVIFISLFSYLLNAMGMFEKSDGKKDALEKIPEGQWLQTNGPWEESDSGIQMANVKTLYSSGENLYAGSSGIYYSTDTGSSEIYYSTDSGVNWKKLNNDKFIGQISAITAGFDSGITYLFVGTMFSDFYDIYGSIFRSSNKGMNWDIVDSSSGGVLDFVWKDKNLFAATSSRRSRIFHSTDFGSKWVEVINGFSDGNPYIYGLTRINEYLFACVSPAPGGIPSNYSSIYKSTDNGKQWIYTGYIECSFIVDITAASSTQNEFNLFVATDCGIFLSTDKGTNWKSVNSGIPEGYAVTSLVLSDINLFAGTSGGGVFLSTNNGTTWNDVNMGLTNTHVNCLVVSGTELFAGTEDGGVWKRPLSDMITAVENNENNIPSYFELEQNYPNPFNPTTKIKYQLAANGIVSLKVYDILGREVATLVNETKSAGNYEANFNAANLSSGIYLYRIQAGNFTESKKMILLK